MAAAAMPPQRPRVVMSTPTAGMRMTWLVKRLLKAKPFSAGVKLMRMVLCLSPKVWLVEEKCAGSADRYWARVLIRAHADEHGCRHGTMGRSHVVPSVVSMRAAR